MTEDSRAKPLAWMKESFDRVLAAVRDRESLHLSQALLLEETGVPVLIRYVVYTLAGVVAAFLLWASLTRIDEVAVTQGKLIPTGHIKRVQSPDGGVVAQILVREGQSVAAGEPLVLMDPTNLASTLEQSQVAKAALELRKARLLALINNEQPDFGASDEKYAELTREQERLHRQKVESMNVRRAILQNEVRRYKAELRSLETKDKALREHHKLIKDEFDAYDSLLKKGMVGKMEFSSVKRQLIQIDENMMQLPITRLQINERLSEAENKLLRLEEESREGWLQELAQVDEELAKVAEAIKRQQQDVNQLNIKAPDTGVVHNLKVHTIGEVVARGGVVLEIVPLGKELIVETHIAPRDIGHMHPGQSVTVKFTAFDFARYGGVGGTLKDISPTAFFEEGQQGGAYYKGIITLDKAYVGNDPERNHVLPGMTVQADIKTGTKTLIGYLFKPIYVSMSQAFRER